MQLLSTPAAHYRALLVSTLVNCTALRAPHECHIQNAARCRARWHLVPQAYCVYDRCLVLVDLMKQLLQASLQCTGAEDHPEAHRVQFGRSPHPATHLHPWHGRPASAGAVRSYLDAAKCVVAGMGGAEQPGPPRAVPRTSNQQRMALLTKMSKARCQRTPRCAAAR